MNRNKRILAAIGIATLAILGVGASVASANPSPLGSAAVSDIFQAPY